MALRDTSIDKYKDGRDKATHVFGFKHELLLSYLLCYLLSLYVHKFSVIKSY